MVAPSRVCSSPHTLSVRHSLPVVSKRSCYDASMGKKIMFPHVQFRIKNQVQMFLSYCMYETNLILQTPIKLKISLYDDQLFLIFYVNEVDVLFAIFHVINFKGHVGPMYNFVCNFGLNYQMTNCEPIGGTQDFTVTVCLQRGAKVELILYRSLSQACTRGVPRCTRTMDHVSEHGAQGQARTQLKAITRRDMCGC